MGQNRMGPILGLGFQGNRRPERRRLAGLLCDRAPVFQKQLPWSSGHQHAREHRGKSRVVWPPGERLAPIWDAEHLSPADRRSPGQSRIFCDWICPCWTAAIEKRRIRNELGILRALPLSYFGIWTQAGLEPAATRLGGDDSILRPVENCRTRRF